jgi:hypothetical protein
VHKNVKLSKRNSSNFSLSTTIRSTPSNSNLMTPKIKTKKHSFSKKCKGEERPVVWDLPTTNPASNLSS